MNKVICIMINNYNKYLVDEFLNSNSKATPSTLRMMENDCTTILEFLSLDKKSILVLMEQEEVDGFIEWMKTFKQYADRTIKRKVCTVRQLLRFCQSKGLISKDKRILISEKSDISEINIVSDECLHKLYAYCSKVYEADEFYIVRGKLAILFVILCGFKISELCELKVDDLSELEKDEINYYHLSDCRIKFIDHKIIEDVLNRYLALRNGGPTIEQLFLSNTGSAIQKNILRDDFKKIRKICGINESIDFSALRNTCIKYYYEQLPDQVIISKIFDITVRRVELLSKSKV